MIKINNLAEIRNKIDIFSKNEIKEIFTPLLETKWSALDIVYPSDEEVLIIYTIETKKKSGNTFCLEFFFDKTSEGVKFRSTLDYVNLLEGDLERIFEIKNMKTIEENFIEIMREIKKYKLSNFY